MREAVEGDAAFKIAFREFKIEVGADRVILDNETVLISKDLAKHLSGCVRCLLLAATLGHNVDNALRRKQAEGKMADAYLYDLHAGYLLEQKLDDFMTEYVLEKEKALKEESSCFKMTTRFSPGFGDFDLSYQPTLLYLVKAEKNAGIGLTDRYLLVPQKSVSAVIGIGGEGVESGKVCCGKCGKQ